MGMISSWGVEELEFGVCVGNKFFNLIVVHLYLVLCAKES